MTLQYTPEAGSFDFKVVQYFITNPDEELTTLDIGEKFGKHFAKVHTLLARAIDAGLLVRGEPGGDGELIYSRGPAASASGIKANKAAHPSLNGNGAWPNTAQPGPKRRSKGRLELPSLDQIPLETNVPIPAKAGGRLATDWPALFSRMVAGQSCVLPRRARATIGKAITKFNRDGGGEMAIRVISDDELRLWRIK